MAWGEGDQVATSPAGGWGANDAVRAPDMSGVREHFRTVRAAQTFTEFLEAGWQQSVTGLASRGKAPDVSLDEEAPMYGRLASGLAGIAGDIPAMIPGFMAGSAAGGAAGGAAGSAVPVVGTAVGAGTGAMVGGFAGASALPAGLRAAMMEAYTKGEVTGAADFVERALHVAWETAKGGAVGAAMGSAGVAARAALPAATGSIAAATAVTGAEVTAMVGVSSALEGKLPEPQDFLDAAVLLGGLKTAASTAGKLRTIYAKTGKDPVEVLADAARDPKLAEELRAPEPMIEIPEAYKPAVTAEAVRAAIPGFNAAAVAEHPFAEIPQIKGEPAKPTHVNYGYLNSSDDVAGALARLSEINEAGIQGQRRGTVSWEQTSREAGEMLADTLGGVDTRLIMPREPGTAAGAAEILARKQLTIGAAEDMATRARAFLERGTEASPEETVAFLASIERAAMIQAEFLGARAEAGRALQILKSTARDAERAKLIKDVVEQYGKDPVELAKVIKEIDNPATALKFAKEAVKATSWEKFVEYWKSVGMLSGPITQVRNIMGNATFLAARPAIDTVAAMFGKLHGGERVTAMEPIARIMGNLTGAADAARAALMVLRMGEEVGAKSKVEQHRKAIEGPIGEVIRLPFRFLSAGDVFFRTLIGSGEGNALAWRMATAEGLHPLTAEFRTRVAKIMNDPPPEIVDAIKAAGERFTFNAEMGEAGQKFQGFVREMRLEWAFPFIRTPANILKETARLTPLAPAIKEWRNDVAKGGAARDKALAELATGTAFMGLFFVLALDGHITGSGPPDPRKRAAWLGAGSQPYSWKWDDKHYSYQGWGPLTTLVGIAADMAIAWDAMDSEARDQLPKILAIAFANAVTNQTALMGMTSLVNVTSDPTRYGPRFLQSTASPVVPALMAQIAAINDPLVRQVDSVFDQIKSRIPGQRETLLPKRDAFGDEIQAKERVGVVSPITVTTESTDKVRTEAARLSVSLPDAPKKVHVGRGSGKLGDVKLTPEQRDIYKQVSGQTAYSILAPIVNGPSWDSLPEIAKRRVFERAFLAARKVGAVATLPEDQLASVLEELQVKLEAELAK